MLFQSGQDFPKGQCFVGLLMNSQTVRYRLLFQLS